MKVLPIAIASSLAGVLLGAGMAYVRVGPATPLENIDTALEDFDAESTSASGPLTPRVVVDKHVFDFGTMQRGATQSHVFSIRNEGDAPLVLSVGGTSCKCTVGEVANEPVVPGRSAPVRLEWVARVAPGPFRQTANLNTNDPLKPSLELSVEGEVVEPIGLEPHDFALGELRVDEAANATIFFFSNEREDLQVSAVGPQDEQLRNHFQLQVTPVDPKDLPNPAAKSGVRITLTSLPGLPIGHVTEWVTLTSNLPESPEIQVPIFGRVTGDISIHGRGWNNKTNVLNLGIVRSASGTRSKLLLSVKGEHASETSFDVIECDPPALRATLGEARKVRESVVHTPLEIEIPSGTRPMIHLNTDQGNDGLIRLKTNHPAAPEVRLRVRFAVEG